MKKILISSIAALALTVFGFENSASADELDTSVDEISIIEDLELDLNINTFQPYEEITIEEDDGTIGTLSVEEIFTKPEPGMISTMGLTSGKSYRVGYGNLNLQYSWILKVRKISAGNVVLEPSSMLYNIYILGNITKNKLTRLSDTSGKAEVEVNRVAPFGNYNNYTTYRYVNNGRLDGSNTYGYIRLNNSGGKELRWQD